MKTVLVSIFTLFLASCSSKPVEQRELYGLWKANYPDAEDTIEIREDGTYIHKNIQKGLPDITNFGTWDLEPIDSSGYQRVFFKDFLSGELTRRKEKPSYISLVIMRTSGNLILAFDPDGKFDEASYTKIK